MTYPSYRPVPGRNGGIRFIDVKGNQCQNPGCTRRISDDDKFCWLCAMFGGQRRIR